MRGRALFCEAPSCAAGSNAAAGTEKRDAAKCGVTKHDAAKCNATKCEEAACKTEREEAVPAEIALDLAHLQNEASAIRHRVVLRALADLGLTQDVGAVHLEALDRLLMRGTTGRTAEFPYGYSAVVRYDRIVFCAPRRATAIPRFTARVVPAAQARLQASGGAKNVAAFDYGLYRTVHGETLPVLRFRASGDVIAFQNGTKKIQDLLVDSKVPRDRRDGVLVAACGSEALWVVGADSGLPDALPVRSRFSTKYPVTADSKEVLLLEIGV